MKGWVICRFNVMVEPTTLVYQRKRTIIIGHNLLLLSVDGIGGLSGGVKVSLPAILAGINASGCNRAPLHLATVGLGATWARISGQCVVLIALDLSFGKRYVLRRQCVGGSAGCPSIERGTDGKLLVGHSSGVPLCQSCLD